MTGREWKPGDVVTATVDGRPNVRVVAGWSRYDPRLRWCEMSPRWADGDDADCWFMPHQVTDHRPLVVIDPEDEGDDNDVSRLCELLGAHHADKSIDLRVDWLSVQAALLEFADPKPPRPDEPQGLGAVIEDTAGTTWVRASRNDPEWRTAGGLWCAWDEIAVARVLSEGWSE